MEKTINFEKYWALIGAAWEIDFMHNHPNNMFNQVTINLAYRRLEKAGIITEIMIAKIGYKLRHMPCPNMNGKYEDASNCPICLRETCPR